MSKQLIPFSVPDLSAFAKSLRAQLNALDHRPTHVEMLNLLAKASGHANFQALRADFVPSAIPAYDQTRVDKVIRHFDAEGRMLRWPSKTNHQELCFWVIWSRIPANERLTEGQLNEHIIAAHLFGDHAILRRSLVDAGMLARTPDGRIYRRVEQTPPADAVALLEAIAARTG
jgi:hypothetical protein